MKDDRGSKMFVHFSLCLRKKLGVIVVLKTDDGSMDW